MSTSSNDCGTAHDTFQKYEKEALTAIDISHQQNIYPAPPGHHRIQSSLTWEKDGKLA